jgi:hypothetical protein
MKVLRLFTDASGESHFDEHELTLSPAELALPAAPLLISEPQPAQGFVVIELPIGWDGGYAYPVPGRNMLLCLAGSFDVTASDGEARTISTGDALLLADAAGKGHSTRVTSAGPVRAIMIRLP